MSVIQPFSAIRYRTQPGQRDISLLLAPPYDVLGEHDKRALLARDPHNFVAIDLPHTPPKAAGPAEVYERAAESLKAWLAAGVLVRDERPALYAYLQQYEHQGVPYTRRMFFARLRIEDFGAGNVYPHERTFGGPKEDRLCLTKATRANLSPIFGLYSDAQNAIARRLEAALPAAPLAEGTLDGVRNRIWAVTDAGAIDEVLRAMADKPVFIADGHHRYGTAQLYRDWLSEQQGPLPADHPANFVLCVFCGMEDPGLLILPTHRVLPAAPVSAELLQADERLSLAPAGELDPQRIEAALNEHGPQAVGLCGVGVSGTLIVRPADAALLDSLEPERSHAWRRLGLAFLHAYLLDRLVTPRLLNGREPEIHYVKSASAAVHEAREASGSAFLLQPTTMEELRNVCQANDLMPQKSTYFFPKLASGLVINSLAP